MNDKNTARLFGLAAAVFVPAAVLVAAWSGPGHLLAYALLIVTAFVGVGCRYRSPESTAGAVLALMAGCAATGVAWGYAHRFDDPRWFLTGCATMLICFVWALRNDVDDGVRQGPFVLALGCQALGLLWIAY